MVAESVTPPAVTPPPMALSSQGFCVTLAAVTAQRLTAHLTSLLHQAPVWGLVERLTMAAWLHRSDPATTAGVATLYPRTTAPAVGATAPITAAVMVADWPKGRLFTDMGEWRWQRMADNGYALLGLSETRAFLTNGVAMLQAEPVLDTAIEEGWQVTTGKQLLIGSTIVTQEGEGAAQSATALAGHSWREVRNPYPLVYPLAHGNNQFLQPRVITRTYANRQGVVRFIRFCSLAVGDIRQEANP